MMSIRKYLLLYLLLAVIGISLIAGIIAWLTTRHEVEELLNHNLKQIARAISQEQDALASFEDMANPNTFRKAPAGRFDGEEDFFIQIWRDGQVMYRSHNLPDFTYPQKDGFNRVNWHGAQWYSYTTHLNHVTVQVSQPFDMQHDMVGEMLPGLLVPLAVQIPILALLIWLIVGRGLRPLSVISMAIGKRNSHSLEPLPVDQTPIEIQPLVSELNELLQRLGTALHMQRQFTADAAHELRTPLTAVQLQLDILQRAKGDIDKEEALRKLSTGVHRSIHLVKQLLSMARQEPDQAPVFIPINLSEAAASAVEQFKLLAEDKGIHLELQASTPVWTNSEAEGIRLLINNLLDNAIRYTPCDGRVAIRVEKSPCTRLIVADTGIGIPEEERSRIFDRFYRIPGSATFGTGLGLAIVKRIADRHNATITIDTGLQNSGASFTIEFP